LLRHSEVKNTIIFKNVSSKNQFRQRRILTNSNKSFVMQKTTLLVFLLFSICVFSQSVATYNITFTNFWNASHHNAGSALPSNAHWSDLVGVNHNSNVTFLEMGGFATTGVENIAELGNQGVFQTVDVQNAIDANNAQQFFDAGDLFLSSGSSTIVYTGLEVNENFPLLTMLSMIAPSPDWMIAVNGINLRENNDWKSSITMDLYPYDAGTEDGNTYSLSNSATNPQVAITNISGVPPFNNQKVAQLTITLDTVLSASNNASSENIKIHPNPSNGIVSISNIKNLALNSVEIYNVLGTLVEQISIYQNTPQINLNLSDLKSGIYLLSLLDDHGSNYTKKLVIN
jgi:hypothetical protein